MNEKVLNLYDMGIKVIQFIFSACCLCACGTEVIGKVGWPNMALLLGLVGSKEEKSKEIFKQQKSLLVQTYCAFHSKNTLYIVLNLISVFEMLSSVWEDTTTCHYADHLVCCFSTEMLQTERLYQAGLFSEQVCS